MNNLIKVLIILLLLVFTLTVLISEENKKPQGKPLPPIMKETSSESICGIVQINSNQLQLVQDSTKKTFNLIIPENLEKELEKIKIGKRYIFSGKNNKNGFVVAKFSIYETAETKGKHSVDSARCIGCRLCVSQCPEGAISMVKGKAVIDQTKCVDCGICVSGKGSYKGCPVKAIKVK